MKKNYTDVTVVIDRSGSMAGTATDTRGGFNRLLEDQKKVAGEATISVDLFDHEFIHLVDAKPVAECPQLNNENYVPRGNTALLDAVGRAINGTGIRLAKMDEKDRPEKVVFVIITDGQENSSKEFTKSQVRDMIKLQQDTYKWEFVFLGANQDAFQEAANFGMKAGSGMTFAANSVGTQSLYASVASNLRSYREGTKADMTFTGADIKKQKDAGAK
jgi:hypothetical protein